MFDWLKRRTSSPSSSRLARLLAGYSAFSPVHLGTNGAAPILGLPVLTLEQCRENLVAYRQAMPARLEALRALLAQLDIAMDDAYARPAAFVAALHATLLAELPPLWRKDLANDAAREASTRAGPDIVLSVMADLAMLEADVLMKAKPGCFIGLNLDPGDCEMLSWRRPCLLGLVDGLFPNIVNIHCTEQDWFGLYGNMGHPDLLAAPDRVMPETWGIVIGGTILQRLDRDVVDPELETKLRTSWYGEAAG